MHISSGGSWLVITVLLLALIGISIGIAILLNKGRRYLTLIILSIAGIFVLILTPFSVHSDKRYFGNISIFEKAVSEICAGVVVGDLVLIDAYLQPFWWYYLNYGCSNSDWVGLPYTHETAIGGDLFYPRTADISVLISRRLDNGNQVFLVHSPHDLLPSYLDEFESSGFTVIPTYALNDQFLELFKIE